VRTFFWVGNHPGIDLCNTSAIDQQGQPVDLLDAPAAVWDWASQAGIAGSHVVRAAADHWASDGDELLDWTARLRDALRDLLVSGRRHPTAAARLAELVADVSVVLTLPPSHDQPQHTLRAASDAEELRLALAQSALDAAGLDPSRIRACDRTRCVLLFADRSKNRSRRWCNMTTCGNREKAAAHYRRHK
jgi:predicted RNA-binding Zn ribbon-like protein